MLQSDDDAGCGFQCDGVDVSGTLVGVGMTAMIPNMMESDSIIQTARNNMSSRFPS